MMCQPYKGRGDNSSCRRPDASTFQKRFDAEFKWRAPPNAVEYRLVTMQDFTSKLSPHPNRPSTGPRTMSTPVADVYTNKDEDSYPGGPSILP